MELGQTVSQTPSLGDVVRATQPANRNCHASWASEDSFHLLKFTDAARDVPSFEMIKLLPDPVADSSWLTRWTSHLNSASDILILFTDKYRKKCSADPESALMKEARLIQKRLDDTQDLHVWVFDPDQVSQGCNAFRTCLIDNEGSMNVSMWQKFIGKVETERAKAAAKETAAALVTE